MAQPTGNNFSNMNNLGLTDSLGIQFTGRTSDPTDSDLSAGRIYYNSTTNVHKTYNGTSWVSLSGAGGGGTPSWEDIFAIDNELGITAGTFTIAQSSANALLTLNKTNVAGGAVIDITNSGTGKDIRNSTTWSLAVAAAVGVLELSSGGTINASGGALTIGSAATNTTLAGGLVVTGGAGTQITLTTGNTILSSGNLTLTSGNVTLTSGTLTLTAGTSSFTSTSNTVATMAIINNTITTYGVGGTGTGMVQIKSTSVTSGAALHVELSETSLTGGFYIQCWDSVAAANSFSVSTKGAIAVLGTAGSNMLLATNGNITLSEGTLTMTRTSNVATLSVTNNTATTASVVVLAGSGVFTGSTTTSWMTVTASGLTTGTVLFMPAAALTTGKIINETANAITTGTMNVLSSTSAVLTSGGFASYTWNPATYTGAGITGLFVSIVDSPTISTTVAGSHNDLNVTRTNATSAAVITYTPSGSIVKIVNASPSIGAGSTLTDSAVVLDVQQNSSTATGAAISVTDVKAAGTGNISLNITANSLTTTTGAITLTANGLTTGVGMSITSTGTIATTGALLSLVGNSATSTNGLVQISGTSLAAGVGILVTGGGANQLAAGSLISLVQGAATVGSAIAITNSGVYTGAGIIQVTANNATTGTLAVINCNALTTGVALTLSNTVGVMTGASSALLNVSAPAATTTTGIVQITAGGLTSGAGLFITNGAGVAQTSAGALLNVNQAASTVGAGLAVACTGVYTGAGVVQFTANSATSGTLLALSATGLTTGIGLSIIGSVDATITTGSYLRISDGTNLLFSINRKGHIAVRQAVADVPTAALAGGGLATVAITAGSTDTAGQITTTGTPVSGSQIVVTFNGGAFANPPRVFIQSANANAGAPNSLPYVTAQSTTSFTLQFGVAGTYASAPSYNWLAIETGVAS